MQGTDVLGNQNKVLPRVVKSNGGSCSNSELSVFSYEATYHAMIEVIVGEVCSERLSDTVATTLVRSHFQPERYVFESHPVYIYKTDPISPVFKIDRIDTLKDSDYELVKPLSIESLMEAFSFHINDDKIGYYTCLVMRSSLPTTFYCIVLSFKDHDICNNMIQSLQTCQKILHMDEGSLSCNIMKINEEIFSYSAIHIRVKCEMYEPDSHGEYIPVPREKETLKVRRNIPKILEIVLRPDRLYNFVVERCFGFLYSTDGNNPEQMKLFDQFTFDKNSSNNGAIDNCYRLRANLDYGSEVFQILESTVTDGNKIVLYCSADLVVKGLVTPIRLNFVAKIKMYPEKERFWVSRRQNMWRDLIVCTKTHSNSISTDAYLINVESIQLEKNASWRPNFDSFLNFRTTKSTPDSSSSHHRSDSVKGVDDVERELILSGTNSFTPEISEETQAEWAIAVETWKTTQSPPNNLQKLLKSGIPHQYRSIVWPMLAGIYDKNTTKHQMYLDLLNQVSEYDKVINRDVTRTFPAHDYFREFSGPGQQKLFRVCKAYASYDPEVGYCQGLSFIVAVLLLHVDEETSFALLVEIMYTLGHRQLYVKSFEELQAQLYVLKRLMSDQIPELAYHLNVIGVEPHMFAPQWFLTLFTAKFPLGLVDQVIDMFLSMGRRSILQISLSLLQLCARDILALNFEETLKFFRLSMPKRFSTPGSSKKLFTAAYSMVLSPSVIEELELDYVRYKKDMIMTQDPLELSRAENKMLFERQLRLEQENDVLAQELVATQIQSKKDLHDHYEKIQDLETKLDRAMTEIDAFQDTVTHLQEQEQILKDELRKLASTSEETATKKESIINEYKKVITTLENRDEGNKTFVINLLKRISAIMGNCEKCKQLTSSLTNLDLSLNNGISWEDALDMCMHTETFVENSAEVQLSMRISQLEMDLAHTKMNLAESESKNEELERSIHRLISSKNDKPWFLKL